MGRFGICLVLYTLCVECCSSSALNSPPAGLRGPEQQPQWNNPAMTQAAYPSQHFNPSVSDYIASNVLRFAHEIGQQLSGKSEVFSPLSVMSALALLLLGAKGNSYNELSRVFGLNAELLANSINFHEEFGYLLEDVQQQPGTSAIRPRQNANWRNTVARNNIRGSSGSNKPFEHIVKVANGVFTQSGYSLNRHYRHAVKNVYRSELDQLDFHRRSDEAREHINSWVETNTFGKIPTIISGQIPRATNVILASTLYFKGFWENSFFEAATSIDNFYPDGQQQPPVKVKMMATGGAFPFYDSPEYNCRIIGLPYKGNLTTMYIIQPNQSTRTVLKEFQRFMDAQKIEEIISKMTIKSAVVAFPKMHFARTTSMKSLLNRMGVNDIFENGFSDLSLIAETSGYGSTSASTPQEPQSSPVFNRAQTTHLRPVTDRLSIAFPNRFAETENATDSPNHTNQLSRSSALSQRTKRQTLISPFLDRNTNRANSLEHLEAQRYDGSNSKSDLYVGEIVHKVDFEVNEQGTEAAAATLTYLRRSGTDVLFRAETPFLLVIRHDPTKLVLFYAIINEPEL